jgi:protein-disulfide isomerase
MYDAEIRAISEKYKLNLKYIYVTDYVSKKALLCDAAKKQNKYWEVHDLIINQDLNDYSELLKLTHQLELDTIKLKKDLENPEIIKSHLKNSDVLINMGFETVPAYIIKNAVFHDPKSIELVLQKEGKI